MIYVLVFFISLIISIFSLPYVIRLLTKLDIVDRPDSRKIHTKPIPRMGGVVIFIITFLTLFCFMPDLNMLRLILISTTLLLICGMVDDRWGLNWKKKFMIQFAAAASAVAFIAPMFEDIRFLTVIIPSPWSYILLTFFIVGAVNSINLLDGMDGLVTGFALIVFFMVFWLAYIVHNTFLAIMCAALVGSTLGFLKYNAYPARIFLGDAGSLVLGMFMVFSALLITPHFNGGRNISMTFPLILLGLPIIDTLKVMTIRIWNGRSPFLPDKNHFHHMLMNSNLRQKTIVFILQIISIGFILMAYLYLIGSKFFALAIFILFALGIIFIKPLLKRIVHSVPVKTKIENMINSVPASYIALYKKFLIPFSIFTAALLITFLLPGRSGMPVLTKLILITSCSALFFISHYQYLKNGVYSETYVLINLLIFSAVASISSPLINAVTYEKGISDFFVRFADIFLIFFIVVFLLTRERLFSQKSAFLSGIDLIIMVLIFLMTVVQNFAKTPGMDFPAIHLLLGFGIYMWYKIIINWRTRYARGLFYFSFVLPIGSLLLMIIL
ncbi:MAG TPA: MraY family glycosyltransferase [Ignavibacteriaceae bacterium]|nr:MraY family glycosyltransferase [Ignavibacteriaceae bacterium]